MNCVDWACATAGHNARHNRPASTQPVVIRVTAYSTVLGLGVAALGAVEPRQVVEVDGKIRMLRA